MIKNNQQLTVTRNQAEELAAALNALDGKTPMTAADQLRRNALAADVQRLEQQITKYKNAVEGRFDVTAELAPVENAGEALVYARIATGITQDELAHQVGVKAQQIQRYEQAQYSTASLATLTKISNAIRQIYQESQMRVGKV